MDVHDFDHDRGRVYHIQQTEDTMNDGFNALAQEIARLLATRWFEVIMIIWAANWVVDALSTIILFPGKRRILKLEVEIAELKAKEKQRQADSPAQSVIDIAKMMHTWRDEQ
jgi:hypothetical protein